MGYPTQDPWQGRAAVPSPDAGTEDPPTLPEWTQAPGPRRLSPLWILGLAIVVFLVVGAAGVAMALYLSGSDGGGGLTEGSTAVTPGPKTTAPRTTGPASRPDGTVAVPNVTGARLEDAQKTLKDAGFQSLRVEDATGQDRLILNPTNWVVRSQSPGPGVPVDPHALITLRVAKPSDDQGSTETQLGTIPNVVCKDLQTAQDTLQAAGFFNLHSKDGTGKGRQQILDRNWVVIAQSVPAGATPGLEASVTLTAVKFGEPTGDSGCPS
jgi:hypothetical protein